MNTLPFHLVYFGGLALGSVILWRHARRRDRAPVLEDHTTAVDRALTALSSLGMFGLPLLHVATPWLSWADYDLGAWALVPGTALFAAGLWLLWRSHSDLGRYWSAGLQIRRRQPVIYEGVYSVIRHPLYAGYWLWGLAQPWLLHNWVAGLAMLATFAPVYLYRVAREEGMLLESLPGCADYAQRTPRLVPRRRMRALTAVGNPREGGRRPPKPPG